MEKSTKKLTLAAALSPLLIYAILFCVHVLNCSYYDVRADKIIRTCLHDHTLDIVVTLILTALFLITKYLAERGTN